MPIDLIALDDLWRRARSSGALGPATCEQLKRHSDGFVAAIRCRFGSDFAGAGLDLGTGVGIPGIFTAWELPKSSWVLLDAAERRCGYASAAVRRLGMTERVSVCHGRGDEIAANELGGPFDVVTTRLLGSPPETLELGLSLVRLGGVLVTSISSAQSRWWVSLPGRLPGVAAVELSRNQAGNFATVARNGDWDDDLPRRPAVRRRKPLGVFHVKHPGGGARHAGQ